MLIIPLLFYVFQGYFQGLICPKAKKIHLSKKADFLRSYYV